MIDRFTDDLLDEVRASIAITSVVAQHVQWDEKKSNPGRRDMWACCPFHAEQSPSFHATDEDGTYHCFGCGASGDHFRFLMEIEGLDFPDAVRAVAGMGGIAMPEGAQGERKPARPPEQPRQTKDRPQPSAAEVRPSIVKTYDYTDRDGGLLYQVVRMQKKLPDGSWARNKDGKGTWKSFLQRRPDGAGHWIWSLSPGEFMRKPGGDWRTYDQDKFADGMETRFFDAGAEHTIYRHPEVEVAIAEGKTILLCYSPDTEVLTTSGWVAFPDLRPGTEIAQYDLATESVSFTVPKAHQRFRYRGEMVNIKADWCDLLVTPDHRQPRRNVRFKNGGEFPCAPSIAPASNIRYGHQLPASGVKRDGRPIELAAARLLVAWLGDGVWEPRGDQVSWNLKKERKKERLRAAFAVLGIEWTEHHYPSTPGWTNFRVAKSAVAEFFDIGPDKRWPWEMLDWSADARGAALDELQHWDGDGASDTSSRFFSGERQSADVVCALAAITGYHANLRVDRRDGKNDSYVVNLSHKTWRQISRTPDRVPYDGEVFCCTVDTGILVVRRNGKVMISGNCEGEKDADTAASLGFCGTTNSSGSKHWTDAHAANFRDADVVICLDNDEAGDRAYQVAKTLKGIARRVRVLDFSMHVDGFDHKGDITDWAEKFGGTANQLEKIIEGLKDYRPRPPQSKFGALGLNELHQPHLKHEFLIDGFLDRRGVAMMPGASASGKTFLVLEMGMCVALNQDFWGMKVKPGLVIYQAGEGKEGLTKRLDGWMLDRGIDPSADIPFRVLPRKINLFVDDKDADDLIEESKAWAAYHDQPVRMVVIDTFNKAITGANENAGQDMGRVLARLERISEALDCVVLVPMHKSKQGDMRGHTSLMGDASNVLNVTKLEIRDGNSRQIRTVSLDKNKDGEGGHPMRFVLRQVVLGEDENGKPRTTCVVDRPNGDEEALTAEGKLSLNQTLFLATLRDAIGITGMEPPSGLKGVPAGKNVVAYKDFEARLWNKWPFSAPEHEPEKRKREFSTAVGAAGKRLVAHGYVERDNETKTIWWTGKSDRPPRKPKPVEPAGTGVAPEVKREIIDMDVPF